VKEIVLTGTHIGQYADGTTDLVRLLNRLVALCDGCRMRLSSLDPRELTDSLLALVCEDPRVCEHVHLSVQSLAPSVLHAMGRAGYNTDALVSRLRALRASAPTLALGGDFIVGYPTESRTDFEQTRDAVRAAGFTHGHVFRYSRRPGTAAAARADQVGDTERKRRSAVLLKLLDNLHRRFVGSQEGLTQHVLIERNAPCQGLSANYLRVGLRGVDMPPNEMVAVRIVHPASDGRLDCWAACEGTAGGR
jgi:threonylcarbamoyladenosine tRNA methylthiotransferase MtaB